MKEEQEAEWGKQKMSFKKQFRQFVDSFRDIKINILSVVFFDLLFYALLIFIPLMVSKFIMSHPILNEMASAEGGVNSLTADQIIRMTPLMKSFMVNSSVSLVLMVVVLFFVYTLTRCLIWNTIEKKKFSLGYFKKSLLLNLTWLPIGSIIVIVVLLLIMPFMMFLARLTRIAFFVYLASFLLLMIFLMIITINFLVYHFFVKQNKIFLSIGKAFTVRFKEFILPLVFMAVVLVVLLLPFGILSYKNLFVVEKYSIIQALILIAYLAWFRIYLVNLVKKEVL